MTAQEFIDSVGGDISGIHLPWVRIGRLRAEYLIKRYGAEMVDYKIIEDFCRVLERNRWKDRIYRGLMQSNEIEAFVDYIMQKWWESITSNVC